MIIGGEEEGEREQVIGEGRNWITVLAVKVIGVVVLGYVAVTWKDWKVRKLAGFNKQKMELRRNRERVSTRKKNTCIPTASFIGNAPRFSKNNEGMTKAAPPLLQSFASTSARPSGTGSKNVQLKINGVKMSLDIPISMQGERAFVVMVRDEERRREGRRVRSEG